MHAGGRERNKNENTPRRTGARGGVFVLRVSVVSGEKKQEGRLTGARHAVFGRRAGLVRTWDCSRFQDVAS